MRHSCSPLFKIIEYGGPEYKVAVQLREDILRKPLGLTFLPEELEKEQDHIHVAGFKGDDIVATAVLVPEGALLKMQRVAIREDFQGKGLGTGLMAFCEDYARIHGFKEIYCHARDTAVPFYLKNKYRLEGDYFDEDSIPHVKMRKRFKYRL